jgi:para-nitrobenzyl esterase
MNALPCRIAFLFSIFVFGPACSSSSTPSTSVAQVSDAAALPDAGSSPVVTIADGQLQGHGDGSVYAFLGIPYAKPPVQDLRWKQPQAPTPWAGVRDASQFGNRCAQNASSTNMTAASTTEDCLYLNVWTPNPSASKLPVMVWIHGGGNFGGSASDPIPFATDGGYFYRGESLASNGAVVVTFNYRLGLFGFFPHPGLVAEGSKAANQALWDQRFALQWVQANIAHFGGDPQNVTIFGESAGSYDVCLHVASPQTPALFERAISESGGCTTRQPTLSEAQPLALGVASEVGCSVAGAGADDGGTDGGTEDGGVADAGLDGASLSASLACMRALTTQALLNTNEENTSSGLAEIFSAVIDDAFLSDQPRTLYQGGSTTKVPYLLGSNNDEGTLFELGVTAVTDQAGLSAAIAQKYGDAGAQIATLYPPSEFDGGEPNPYQAALTRIVGDSLIVCETYDSALLAANQGVVAHMYNFDIPVVIPGVVGSSPGEIYLGASHGSELPYVFGTDPQLATNAQQASASQLIERYWTRFAGTGNPNGGSDLSWPSFSATDNVRIQFTLQPPTIITNFRADECAFWISTYEAAFTDPAFQPSL